MVTMVPGSRGGSHSTDRRRGRDPCGGSSGCGGGDGGARSSGSRGFAQCNRMHRTDRTTFVYRGSIGFKSILIQLPLTQASTTSPWESQRCAVPCQVVGTPLARSCGSKSATDLGRSSSSADHPRNGRRSMRLTVGGTSSSNRDGIQGASRMKRIER